MEERVSEPLLSDVGPTTFTSTSEYRHHEFRRRLKACSVGLWEDDEAFLASAWSRRPYLGYTLPTFLAIAAFSDVPFDMVFSHMFTTMEVIAAVMSAVILRYLDNVSKWVELFVCAQCMSLSAALSYSLNIPYYSTATQASYSLILIFLGLRTRYLASANFLVFVLFDRSTGGVLFLAISIVCCFFCGSLVHTFFYKAFSLQRSQDALIQYASDGFCSVSANHGHVVFACSRFQDVFKSHDLCGRRLQDFIHATDESRMVEMLRCAKQGSFNQCLVTCYVSDTAIAFDAALIPYQYNHQLDTVDVCLKIQGEVRPYDTNSVDHSGVVLPCTDRNQNVFVDIDGTSYHEIQVQSSAQQSDDSMYAILWDIIDAAASDNIVRSFGARAVVMEAQQMQTLIFTQQSRALQRAVTRSLLARYDRMRMDALCEDVCIEGLRPVIWQDRHIMNRFANLVEDGLSSRERMRQDVVSAYRVFYHSEVFRCNPCLLGLSTTCEMLGFFGALPHHQRSVQASMMNIIRRFECE